MRSAQAVVVVLVPCLASVARAEEPRAPVAETAKGQSDSAPVEAPAATTSEPPAPSEAAPAPAATEAPALSSDALLAAGPRVPEPPPTPAPASDPRLLGLRLPTFIAFSVGGLGAGGAVVTRLAASTPYNDPKLGCAGRCADGSRTLGVTSTVLAGIAAAAVGTGVVLALTESGRREHPQLAPVLKMSVSPSKAAASALWTF